MKVSDLGEFGLIDLLAKMTEAGQDMESQARQQLILGIGDDAAAWQSVEPVQLVTVDSLIQDVHFSLDLTSWRDLGWKAMAANLSDIAAMGGHPRYALVSLALPADSEVGNITALYRGMIELTSQFGVAIIGGNISSAPILVINITVLGSTDKRENMLTRASARPGQQIAITGFPGASAAGLEVLKKKLTMPERDAESLRKAFRQPVPRVNEGRRLVEHGVRTAIDTSDGLLADLGHICQASKVSARIETASVPVHLAIKANFGDRALGLALSGGEDYELLFTASRRIMSRVKESVSIPVTVIGEITGGNPGQITLVDINGNPVSQDEKGWDHFRSHKT